MEVLYFHKMGWLQKSLAKVGLVLMFPVNMIALPGTSENLCKIMGP